MSLLLGVPDRLVKGNETTTWDTNKIGGTPDWFQANTPLPCCRRCQREMTLVIQIYCPLTNSPFHRCLHIFVCPLKPCSMQSCGWRVVRTQQLDASASQQSKVSCADDEWTTDQDDWGVGQIDWGDDDEEDEGQENPQEDHPFSASQEMMTDRLSEMSVSGQHHFTDGGSPCFSPGRSSTDQPLPGPHRSVDSPARQGDNTTDSGLPSTGDGDTEPSEQVEAEAVAVDDEGLQRMMGLLAADGEGCGTNEESDSKTRGAVQRETFPAYYLNVFAERDLEEETSDDHVTTLLRDYQQREGLHFSALLSDSSKGGQSGADAEKYNKTEVTHGDKQCYKFIKRLQACPQQCIRYQWKGSPLLMSQGSQESWTADRCERCQASRVFELQLVPPLVPLLSFPPHTEPQVEFGTVLVFTCSASCWWDGETSREELVLLQHDPDQHLFK